MLPLEEAIIEKLQGGPCWFDEIVMGLPNFSWGEIFVTIDCMSRDGRVCLHRLGYSTYQISFGSAKRVAAESNLAGASVTKAGVKEG